MCHRLRIPNTYRRNTRLVTMERTKAIRSLAASMAFTVGGTTSHRDGNRRPATVLDSQVRLIGPHLRTAADSRACNADGKSARLLFKIRTVTWSRCCDR